MVAVSLGTHGPNDREIPASNSGLALWSHGPLIIDYFKRRRENEEVRQALRIELMELRYRLAVANHAILMRTGDVNRENLLWLRPILVSYTGINPVENVLRYVDSNLAMSDAELAFAAQAGKSPPEGAIALQKYPAPLLDSRFALITSFETHIQNQLLEVRAHLGLFNEEVDQARYYLQLTFS